MALNIALVAHDARKEALVDWARDHAEALARHRLHATGTTGGRLAEALGLEITRLKSGPLGGDAQIGAMIAEGRIDVLVFFIDPMSALPHDVDVKSLLRLATLYDIHLAMTAVTASAILREIASEE